MHIKSDVLKDEIDMVRKSEYNERLSYVFVLIGENIKRMRGGMSKVDLAKKAKVNRNTIWAIENGGNITLENLIKIADALGVPPAELLIEDGSRGKETFTLEKLVDVMVEEKLKKLLKN